MRTKSSAISADKLIRKTATDSMPPPTEADLARLRNAGVPAEVEGEGETPLPKVGSSPVRRDLKGRLPRPVPEVAHGMIRRAVIEELGRRKITRYQLWKEAREHCATLPESAVYEFIRGQRDV